ncbi:MAG: hypothetical protein AAB371_01880 [Patescibacteria group bacterium]
MPVLSGTRPVRSSVGIDVIEKMKTTIQNKALFFKLLTGLTFLKRCDII